MRERRPGRQGRKGIPGRGSRIDKGTRCMHIRISKRVCSREDGGETGQTVRGPAAGPQLHLEQRVGSETQARWAPRHIQKRGFKADVSSQLHLLQRLPS